MNTTLKGLITSFSRAVDVYNFLLKNHHRHAAIAAYAIGKQMGLDDKSIGDLVISAALHDIGALSIKERNELVRMDVDNPNPHCRLGSYMLESFDPFEKISKIIYYHHWPYNKKDLWIPEKGEVPIESYILHVADRIDILIQPNESLLPQKRGIREKISSYSGTLFNPEVVNAFKELAVKDSFWLDIENLDMDTILQKAIPEEYEIELSLDLLEQFAFTISKIIDSRSKFTISHSFGVSELAYRISKLMGYSEEKSRRMRVAGLLHDMGKIAVPVEIIEKAGALNEDERADVQVHPYFTNLILKDMEGLGEIAQWAACHHENHDGSGYPKNMADKSISQEMDIISYADIYTALSEERPYRASLESSVIMDIIRQQYLQKHGKEIYEVILENVDMIDSVCKSSLRDGENRYNIYEELSEKYAALAG